MSYVLNDPTGVRIEGDEAGFWWVRKQLPVAPSSTRMIRLVYRLYCNRPNGAGAALYTGRAWNHTNLFGLSFDPDVPAYPNPWVAPYRPDRFFGWLTEGPRISSGTPIYDSCGLQTVGAWAQGGGTSRINFLQRYFASGSDFQALAFMNGIGGAVTPGTTAQNMSGVTIGTGTDFAGMTWGWEIRSDIVTKAMSARLVVNGLGLTGAGMFDVFTDPWNETNEFQPWSFTIHGDVTSHFRPSDSAWVWPRWLMLRYSLPQDHLILTSDLAVRYYQEGDPEL